MKSVPKVGATPFIYKTIYGDIFNATAGALKMILNTAMLCSVYRMLPAYVYKGACTNHVDSFWDFLTPLPQRGPIYSYNVDTFSQFLTPPLPCCPVYTWFVHDPLQEIAFGTITNTLKK